MQEFDFIRSKSWETLLIPAAPAVPAVEEPTNDTETTGNPCCGQCNCHHEPEMPCPPNANCPKTAEEIADWEAKQNWRFQTDHNETPQFLSVSAKSIKPNGDTADQADINMIVSWLHEKKECNSCDCEIMCGEFRIPILNQKLMCGLGSTKLPPLNAAETGDNCPPKLKIPECLQKNNTDGRYRSNRSKHKFNCKNELDIPSGAYVGIRFESTNETTFNAKDLDVHLTMN